MNLDSFLKRIGLDDLPDSPIQRLQALQCAMPRTIPFENLAILEGKQISLDPATIFEKVVRQGRGGYCFELNGLLAALLEMFGYRFDRLLGRVWVSGATAPLLTHMALRVWLDGQAWLCDVGFGGGTLRAPLLWKTGMIVNQSPDSFRLDETGNGEIMLSRLVGSDWRNLYSLLPCPVRVQDYVPANYYTSTNPDSYFTQSPVAALTKDDGLVTLRGRIFRKTGRAGESEHELATFDELMYVLATEFGLADLDTSVLEARLAGMFDKP